MEKQIERLKRLMSKAQGSGKNKNAGVLCTTVTNYPMSRTVLFGWEGNSLIFYTNYDTKKSKSNEPCSIVFYWPELKMQVRVFGITERCSPEVSDKYWKSRGRIKQIASKISNQSEKLPSRYTLIRAFLSEFIKNKGEVERPKNWGGVLVHIKILEFMTESSWRLHKREFYSIYDEKKILLWP